MSFKLLLTSVLFFLLPMTSSNPIAKDGTFRGQRLCGRVKIVTSGKAFRVKVVERFEDIRVKLVDSFPNNIGEWKIVENFEDFRIRFVDSHEDFRIKYVDRFPGRRDH